MSLRSDWDRNTAVGILWLIVLCSMLLAPDRLKPPSVMPGMDPSTVQGARHVAAVILGELEHAVHISLWFLLSRLLLRIVLRKEWLAGTAFVIFWTCVFGVAMTSSVLWWIGVALIYTLGFLLLTRLGLVAFAAGMFAFVILVEFPITADPEKWYWGTSLFALATIASVGAYGLYTSLAGRPVFGFASRERL